MASRQNVETRTAPPALLWQQMRGFRGKYACHRCASDVETLRLALAAQVVDISTPSPAHGKIEVTDLVYGYTEESAAINGIYFTVEPGETLAILGPSGAGKSTILHLLLRLYDYSSGSIQFDGRELTDLDRQWVRSQFSVVMQ